MPVGGEESGWEGRGGAELAVRIGGNSSLGRKGSRGGGGGSDVGVGVCGCVGGGGV